MCSLARATAATYPASVISASAAPGATGSATGTPSGPPSASIARSTAPRSPVTVIVRRTWSNPTTVSASRNRIVGRPASAPFAAGSGTGSSSDTQS
jgi:hypothetical protein